MIFQEAPQNFSSQVEVVACFLNFEDSFLFLHRPAHKRDGNLWGIPGGKRHTGESSEQAILREVWEETGFEMSPQKLTDLGKVFIRDSTGFEFTYSMYEYVLEDFFDVRINLEEHKGFSWMELSEALHYPLIPDEDACIKHVYGVEK